MLLTVILAITAIDVQMSSSVKNILDVKYKLVFPLLKVVKLVQEKTNLRNWVAATNNHVYWPNKRCICNTFLHIHKLFKINFSCSCVAISCQEKKTVFSFMYGVIALSFLNCFLTLYSNGDIFHQLVLSSHYK